MSDTLFAQDFFTAQRQHKKISFLFYGLFLFIVVLHAVLLLIVCVILTVSMTGSVNLSYWLAAVFGLFLYIAFGVGL